LRAPDLKVQAAHGSADRLRVVVLDERAGDAARKIFSRVIGFEEESPAVAMDVRLDDDHAGQLCLLELHGFLPDTAQPRTRQSGRRVSL